jgi:hypothetical protein
VPRARSVGIQTMLTPVRTPRANAVAERLVGTLRRECLAHLVVPNEAHLRAVWAELARYSNEERPHRPLDVETPACRLRPATGPIRHRPVLGGLHNVCERAARPMPDCAPTGTKTRLSADRARAGQGRAWRRAVPRVSSRR